MVAITPQRRILEDATERFIIACKLGPHLRAILKPSRDLSGRSYRALPVTLGRRFGPGPRPLNATPYWDSSKPYRVLALLIVATPGITLVLPGPSGPFGLA